MTASDTSTPKMASQDERVHALLCQAKDEFENAAHFLSEYGISTDLAQQAASLLSKPLLMSCYETQERLQETASKIVDGIVRGYIKSIFDEATVASVWAVERPDSRNALEYTIALKDNSLDNRALFREFRLDYAESGFNDLVPLTFHLIPEALSENILMSKKLELV